MWKHLDNHKSTIAIRWHLFYENSTRLAHNSFAIAILVYTPDHTNLDPTNRLPLLHRHKHGKYRQAHNIRRVHSQTTRCMAPVRLPRSTAKEATPAYQDSKIHHLYATTTTTTLAPLYKPPSTLPQRQTHHGQQHLQQPAAGHNQAHARPRRQRAWSADATQEIVVDACPAGHQQHYWLKHIKF